MSINPLTVLAAITLFVLVFVLGFVLKRRGRPHHVLLLTAHKLLALAALILLAAGFTLGWIGCAICASGKREDACRAAYNEGIRRAAQTRAELFELATDGLDAGDEP